MPDPRPAGYSPYADPVDPYGAMGAIGGAGMYGDEEALRRQREAMAQLAGLPWQQNVAGPPAPGGPLGQAPMPAPAAAPPAANPMSQNIQALNDIRGPLPAGMGNPLSATNGVSGQISNPGQWYTGWGQQVQTPGQQPLPMGTGMPGMTPGMLPGSGGAGNAQQIFQQAIDRNLNTISGGAMFKSPEMWAQAQRLAEAEVAPHLQEMQNAARIKEAELKHQHDTAPETFAQKAALAAYGTALGQVGGTPEKARASMMLAYKNALGVSKELTQAGTGVTGAVANQAGNIVNKSPFGTDWKKLEEQAGGKGTETELADWKHANIDVLPPTMGITRNEKGLPPVMGGLQRPMDQDWAHGILTRAIDLYNKDPKAAENLVSEIGDANPQAKRALLQAAAGNKMGGFDQAGFLKSIMANNPGAQNPGDLGTSAYPIDLKVGPDEPFSFRGPEGATMASRALQRATGRARMPFPEILTEQGERLPVNLDPYVAGPFSDQARIKAESQRLMPIADLILKAYAKKR